MDALVRIDKRLLGKAFRIGRLRTRSATIEQALTEFIMRREQLQITEIFGTIDIDPAYDYKSQRNRP